MPPRSGQDGPHPRLEDVVRRHLDTGWDQPIRTHTRESFESLRRRAEAAPALVIDAGCGTGVSTAQLAARHPQALVVGVDKSSVRLVRAPAMPANAVLLRAELADFWRLAHTAGWRPSHHYLLYPNPWPKPAHLMRRWHAHPVFPDLLALGGRLELRTNFEIYALEFARALELAGVNAPKVVSFTPDEAISPFERKYHASGHRLFRLHVNLEDPRK